MTTVQELPTNPIPPFPFFVENPVELIRTDLPTNKVNSIPNPIPNPSHVQIDTNPQPDRCQFTFSDGRRCTMARSEIHPSLCPYHAEREEQLFGVPSPGGTVVGRAFDLPELYSACHDLTTAAGVNRALAQVFRLLAQRRISRQEAATFGHLAQLLLRTISLMCSSRESHGDQELSPRDKVPSTFVPQPRDPGTPPETPVIPNPPSAGVSHNQRAQTVGSNSRNMNTCTEPVSNRNKMNTYEIAELKVVHNEHLHQESRRDDTTIAQRGSTGTRSIRKFVPSPERGDTP